MHNFSDLFDKVLYMFRTGPLSIIRSISTLYTRNRYVFVMLVLLASASRRQQYDPDQYVLRVYSVELLLMMDSGPVRNM
jgi:cation transporter-like permease